MGQVLHGNATTTHAIRSAIQRSKASLQALSERYGINPKTVAKWRRRTSFEDRPMGPKVPRSTVLSVDEETLVIEFRRRTLLPLDDCLYALQATIPRCIGFFNAMGSIGSPRPPPVGRARRSKPIRWATSTSISPRSGPRRASCICSWPLTGSASSPFRNSTIARRVGSRRTSSAGYLNTSRTGSTPCSPTTAFSSRSHVAAGVLARFGRCSRHVSAFGRTPLTTRAPSTLSTIGSRNSTIRGPTVKSNG